MDYPFDSRHKGPGFKSPGGYLCETGILLLALSHYSLTYLLVLADHRQQDRTIAAVSQLFLEVDMTLAGQALGTSGGGKKGKS